MTQLREGLPPVPARMQKLPLDPRGYPIPWFVATQADGTRDFRVADAEKNWKARNFGYCWVCGERVGKWKTFVIGPMCAVNRTTSEPPCHLDCATFSAIACPFLTLPKAVRRDANLPTDAKNPAGEMLTRNPGVTCLWTTLSYRPWRVENGVLYKIGAPHQVQFYTQKRLATREEVLESIDSGMPHLRKIAYLESPIAVEALDAAYEQMLPLLPVAA